LYEKSDPPQLWDIMLLGNRIDRLSAGANVHIFSPFFNTALPASFAGAVNRINASSCPRVHATMVDERFQSGRWIRITSFEYELAPRVSSSMRLINSSAVKDSALATWYGPKINHVIATTTPTPRRRDDFRNASLFDRTLSPRSSVHWTKSTAS
jgi:hypothetical protein